MRGLNESHVAALQENLEKALTDVNVPREVIEPVPAVVDRACEEVLER